MSVVVQSRLGVAALVHADEHVDLNTLITQAVLDAARGRKNTTVSSAPVTNIRSAIEEIPNPDCMRTLPWLAEFGNERQTIEYRIDRGSASTLSHTIENRWTDFAIANRPLARAPTGAPPAKANMPRHHSSCWLIPPIVLSQLFLEPIMNGLTGRGTLRKWPHVRLLDPAWGGGIDLDGHPRTPTIFAHHNRLLTKPTERRQAWTEGQPQTGHAGIAGAHIRDLLVAADEPPDEALPPGTVVMDGRCLAAGHDGRDALVALELRDPAGSTQRPRAVILNDLTDLLDLGTWHGPWQRGLGPWTSRWLAIGEPQRCLRPRPL
ncbi:hypothetical protein [Gandjariella thermophila]|uniref:hypothetical protein n=1 Tax=Gandjariella thermophila TaxID=1931992 RepID=UPI0010F6535E|nr:hypothetical protein [Gandjariella thermophila]